MTKTIVSKRKMGFTTASVYRRREPHAFTYLSERATFWIAVISVLAFVTGNMVGQHGWNVFWKSVMGEGAESTIAFTGTVPPIAKVPDYAKWAKLGGDVHVNTFRQVPQDVLVPLPTYIRHGDDLSADPSLRFVYLVEHLGTYENGRGEGSHAGIDISVPDGTPILSIANGVVEKVGNDPGGYGNYVVVKHPNVPNSSKPGTTQTLHSVYAHLSAAIVREGDIVMKGDQVALSGHTGNATAPHLHFQVDRDDAPWHPFWPFNTSEMNAAHLNFVQAVDDGLNRERGLEFTLDAMLFVQSYSSYAPVVVASSSSAKPAAQAPARAVSIAQRREQRLAKLLTKGPLVAIADDAPIMVIPASSSSSSAAPSSSSSSSSAAPVVHEAPSDTEVAAIDIRHDGAFQSRTWETITLVLLNANGGEISNPAGNRKFGLVTAYGRAEFKPSVFTASDFKNGRMTVEMLPLGEQTVVIQVEPLKTLSKPIKLLK